MSELNAKCIFGHKWSEESKGTVIHTREVSTKSVFVAMEYGSSNYYKYKCERCGKKQWYAERINVGIGLNRTYRAKIDI